MMKKTVVAALFALTPLTLAAAPINTTALRAYITKALVRCPDAKIDLQPINDPGPSGFLAFHVTQTSSDTGCGRRAFVLYSPTSNQVRSAR